MLKMPGKQMYTQQTRYDILADLTGLTVPYRALLTLLCLTGLNGPYCASLCLTVQESSTPAPCDFGQHRCPGKYACTGHKATGEWPSSAGVCLRATVRYVPSYSTKLRYDHNQLLVVCAGSSESTSTAQLRFTITAISRRSFETIVVVNVCYGAVLLFAVLLFTVCPKAFG